MNLKELGEYKSKIIHEVITHDDIVSILLPEQKDDVDLDDQLLGNPTIGEEGCVFDFEYVPDTQEVTKTFLCVESTIKNIEGSTYSVYIYVFCFCNKKIMKLPCPDMVGTRADTLAHKVDMILNGNTNFGIGRLNLVDVDVYTPSSNYYGKCLLYEVNAFLRDRSLNKYEY